MCFVWVKVLKLFQIFFVLLYCVGYLGFMILKDIVSACVIFLARQPAIAFPGLGF